MFFKEFRDREKSRKWLGCSDSGRRKSIAITTKITTFCFIDYAEFQ